MKKDLMEELLLEKELEELYQLRGEQYTSKEELVDDIIASDDGSVAELLQLEGGFLGILTRGYRAPSLKSGARLSSPNSHDISPQ